MAVCRADENDEQNQQADEYIQPVLFYHKTNGGKNNAQNRSSNQQYDPGCDDGTTMKVDNTLYQAV